MPRSLFWVYILCPYIYLAVFGEIITCYNFFSNTTIIWFTVPIKYIGSYFFAYCSWNSFSNIYWSMLEFGWVLWIINRNGRLYARTDHLSKKLRKKIWQIWKQNQKIQNNFSKTTGYNSARTSRDWHTLDFT